MGVLHPLLATRSLAPTCIYIEGHAVLKKEGGCFCDLLLGTFSHRRFSRCRLLFLESRTQTSFSICTTSRQIGLFHVFSVPPHPLFGYCFAYSNIIFQLSFISACFIPFSFQLSGGNCFKVLTLALLLILFETLCFFSCSLHLFIFLSLFCTLSGEHV